MGSNLMLKKIVLLSLCISFYGCSAMVNSYNKSNIASNELARITGTETDKVIAGFSNTVFSRIAWAYNKDGEKVIDKGWSNTWGLTEVTLEPGFYVFILYCGRGDIYAMPHIRTFIEPSKEYMVTCELGGNTPELKGKMRGHIHEIPSTSNEIL